MFICGPPNVKNITPIRVQNVELTMYTHKIENIPIHLLLASKDKLLLHPYYYLSSHVKKTGDLGSP